MSKGNEQPANGATKEVRRERVYLQLSGPMNDVTGHFFDDSDIELALSEFSLPPNIACVETSLTLQELLSFSNGKYPGILIINVYPDDIYQLHKEKMITLFGHQFIQAVGYHKLPNGKYHVGIEWKACGELRNEDYPAQLPPTIDQGSAAQMYPSRLWRAADIYAVALCTKYGLTLNIQEKEKGTESVNHGK